MPLRRFRSPTPPRLTINASTSGPTKTTLAGYVLISFGPDGHGAWPRNVSGTSVTRLSSGSVNIDELTNCHCDSTGVTTNAAFSKIVVQKPYAQNPSSIQDSFDDVVVYGTRFDSQPDRIVRHGPGSGIERSELAAKIKALKAASRIEGTPQRSPAKVLVPPRSRSPPAFAAGQWQMSCPVKRPNMAPRQTRDNFQYGPPHESSIKPKTAFQERVATERQREDRQPSPS